MNDRVKRFKKHVKENKKVYISGVAGAIIGVCGVIVFKRLSPKVMMLVQPEIMAASASVQNGLASYKPTTKIYQTVSKYGNVIGRPGKAIYDTTTNKRYESQTLGALAVNTSNAKMSKHLNGKKAHVNGHVFEWVD